MQYLILLALALPLAGCLLEPEPHVHTIRLCQVDSLGTEDREVLKPCPPDSSAEPKPPGAP